MSTLFQVATVLAGIIAIFQKKKWAMMLVYTFSNIMNMAVYFAFARYTSAYICIIAAFRTMLFMIFALKNWKPNVYVLIFFELAFVVSTALTWQDTLDLMPLFALLIAGYASWQNNQYVLRVGYIINPALYIIYKIIIGAYIAAIAEIICFIASTFSFLYYCIFKKEKSIFQQLDFISPIKKSFLALKLTDYEKVALGLRTKTQNKKKIFEFLL